MPLKLIVGEEILKSQDPEVLNDYAIEYLKKINAINGKLDYGPARDRAYIANIGIATFLQTRATYFQNKQLLEGPKEEDC